MSDGGATTPAGPADPAPWLSRPGSITYRLRLEGMPMPPGSVDNPTARAIRAAVIDLVNVELRRLLRPMMGDREFEWMTREQIQDLYSELVRTV